MKNATKVTVSTLGALMGLAGIEHVTNTETSDSGRKSLYRFGGVVALMAGVIFRRNLGPEISLFSAQKQPGTIIE